MGRDHGDFAGRVQRVGGCGRISRQVGSGVVRNFFFFFILLQDTKERLGRAFMLLTLRQ